MTIVLTIIKSFLNRIFKSSAVKLFGGVIGGIIFTLLTIKLWSSLGSKYTYMILAGIIVVALILLIIYLLWKNLQVNRSKKMEAALEENAKQKKQRQKQLKTAIGSLKDKWQTAMATLKSAKINIYDIPWVLIIGEPQSGKTTTLKRSGLDFPIGRDALSGAGGTVNCDWWFTNDAVVIDTAGRFTMPVDSAPDKDEWHAFLKLLVKYRPKCPINNVIVTIPVTSFIEDDEDRIQEKAAKIRDKLLEITKVLGVEFPVYIMVSKSDLINGFTEFCGSLSSIENTQILGWNEAVESDPFNPGAFKAQFENLRQRFYKWSLRRLRDLPVGKEADQIFSFHSEFKDIKAPLESYLSNIFKEDKFHSSLIFRGCFFSSGLQEGQAIVKALEEGNVLNAEQYSESFSKSRPYFIYNFYKKVFLENGLVSRVGKVTQKERKFKAASIAIACLFSVVSIWYLWTGYSMLTKVLKPTQTRVEQVMKVMSSHKIDSPEYQASKIVQLAGTVESDRKRLASESVSYRFLKGKNNSIARDMKNIEDAILLKGLFQPIMKIADRNVNKHPGEYLDKVRMFNNLSLGLGILVDSPNDLYSLESNILIVKSSDPWMNIEADTVIDLANEFPKGDALELNHPNPSQSRIHIRQEISGLNNFWKIYPEMNWMMLKKDLLETMRLYRSMLADDGKSMLGENAFKHNAVKFISTAGRLLEYSDGKNALFPGKLFNECEDDYNRLATIVDKGKVDDEIAFFQPTITRHSSVCQKVNSQILADLRNHPELLNFLVTEDGNIHPEFEAVLSIVDSVLKFSPLFLETHRQMVLQNPERIEGFLEAWDTEWHAKKTDFEKTLSEKIKALTAPGWKKEQLEKVVSIHLNNEIWEADLQAALEAISAILKGNDLKEKVLTRSMVLPNAARTKWLEEKFTLFAGINSWLIKKYPSRPDISRGTDRINRAMTGIYKKYLTFWNNTLRNYDPSASIVRTNSWDKYREQVLKKRGVFLDPGAWPFNMFLENVTLTGLDNLKKILGEDRDKSTIKLEKNITRTAYVYSMVSGNLGALGGAQDRFYQCVDSLSDSPSEALSALEEGLMEDFNAFSSFRRRVDSGLGGGEMLAGRLENVQKHGLYILKKGFASGFVLSQKALIDKWYESFRQSYPLVSVDKIEYWSKLEVNVISQHYSTAQKQSFYDFCFDENLSVDVLEKKYGIRKAIAKSPNSEKYTFIKPAIEWKDFLYDNKKSAKVHEIKISLSGEHSDISKKYTVLKIRGLHKDGGSKTLKLRFSGRRYKTTNGVWHIDQHIPVQFSVENEETREFTGMALLENNFSFPAYIVKNGKKTRSSNTREWKVPLNFFDKSSVGDTFRINLIIEWDESLPEYIPWKYY